jgi:hypothetical protein
MLPLISFEIGRKHKLNLLFKTTRWSEAANGSLVLSGKGSGREANTRGEESERVLYPRSPEARRESFCLTKTYHESSDCAIVVVLRPLREGCPD